MKIKYSFNMPDLLEAGVHYGHRKNLWNPKMARYIYGVRNSTHIIDLQQTVPMLVHGLNALREVASKNGRVLFVGTKPQASDVVKEFAAKCGQYYIAKRWLGGTLTNWKTVSESIKTLKKYEAQLADETLELTKKERIELTRKYENLEEVLGGIRNMGGMPQILFIIDTNQESLAITEAKKLGIPVVAICDTNSCPDGIDYLIPGNDDATRAIELYCRLACEAVLHGMQESANQSGLDLGATENLEDLPEFSKDLNATEKTTSNEESEA